MQCSVVNAGAPEQREQQRNGAESSELRAALGVLGEQLDAADDRREQVDVLEVQQAARNGAQRTFVQMRSRICVH